MYTVKLVSTGVFLAALVGCAVSEDLSGSGERTERERDDLPTPNSGGTGNGTNTGTGGDDVGLSRDAGAAGGSDSSPLRDGEACTGKTADAELSGMLLAVLLDRSGSMGDNNPPYPEANHSRKKKWDPVTAALKAFFADPSHDGGLKASLEFFPNAIDAKTQCDPQSYVPPTVPFTPLPDNAFISAIDSVEPNLRWTPTYPALQSTLQFLSEADAPAGTHRAVLLVTDGEPVQLDGNASSDCQLDNTTTSVAVLAGQWSDRVRTFVIGVGELDALDGIARAGGTDSAYLVPADDAEATKDALKEAVNEIRATVACALTIPQPPGNEALDVNAVNVFYEPPGKSRSMLAKDQGCASGLGWQYDDPDDPKTIELCATTCGEVRDIDDVGVGVEFGCVTRVY